ncbi:MAG: GHMP kinase [Candidatus Nezhaarchaeota archaeon]|nr:GHMP kinase [Candidatus Nezhaarchaeota archaeon]
MILRVWISAPSRLHFGMINPLGVEGRQYVSLGVGIEEPRTVVEAEPSNELIVEGVHKRLSQRFAEKVIKAFSLKGAKIKVHSTAPRHVGLGSTTQLALATAYALLAVNRVDKDVVTVSKALGLGKQSGIGTYVFERGGFILDGGIGRGRDCFPPLLLRLNVPEWWSFIVIVPVGRGLSERTEMKAFASLKSSTNEWKLVGKAASIALCKLIPALVEDNVSDFGKALIELQETVGMMFSKVQGGIYNPVSAKVIEVLKGVGVEGYGQSSWGPAVYAVTSDEKAEVAVSKIRKRLKMRAKIFIVKADNHGANITETK